MHLMPNYRISVLKSSSRRYVDDALFSLGRKNIEKYCNATGPSVSSPEHVLSHGVFCGLRPSLD